MMVMRMYILYVHTVYFELFSLLQGTFASDGQSGVAFDGQPGADGQVGNPGAGGPRCQPVCTTRCFR